MGKVHVAGTGLISAIGHSTDECLDSLKKERTGVGPLTLFDSFHKNLPVAEVKNTNQELVDRLKVATTHSRTTLLGLIAAREALKNAEIKNFKKWRSGFISATTVGGMDKTETFFPAFLADPKKGKLRDVINHPCGSSTDIIASDLQVNGFRSTVNTACSSSVNSIMLGARMINAGLMDVIIAGGADALTKFTLNGFNSLMILDRQPCRPFDASRSGLNLGEGAGFVVLVSDQVAEQEDLSPVCFVGGFGNTTDAYHQTASSPEGRGSFSAMQSALSMSKLKVEDIDYINLHGTGTVNNDLSEGTAVKRLFGENLPRMSSTKAFTGHTLGASGGIEAVFSVLAITNRCVFPNLRFETTMPEHGVTPQKKFETISKVDHVMSNSFGFGGNCTSIIFSRN